MRVDSTGLPKYFIPVALISSLVLSWWKIYFTPLLNPDGILYLIAADEMITSGFSASITVYNWPFFQMAIAGIHKFTGLPLLGSGQLLMICCFFLLAVAFCLVVRELNGRGSTLWFALLVILCHPILNDFRPSLVRDPGMIAFVFLALLAHLKFSDSRQWRHCLQWSIYLTVAFLFRVEVTAIIILAPLAMLFLSRYALRERLLLCAKMYALPTCLAILLLSLSTLLPHEVQTKFRVLNDLEFLRTSVETFNDTLNKLSTVIASSILTEFSDHDAKLAFFSIIVTLVIASLTRAITLPYLVPLILSWTGPRSSVGIRTNPIPWWYVFIVACYLLCFVLFARFSLTRHSLQLALLVLITLPFSLDFWWYKSGSGHVAKVLIALALVANGLDSLISSDWKKIYIDEAASWVKAEPAIEKDSLLTNEPYIGYFGEKTARDDVLRSIYYSRPMKQGRRELFWLSGYTYAQRVPSGPAELQLKSDIRLADGKVLRVFKGADNRSIYIFSIAKDTPRSAILVDSP